MSRVRAFLEDILLPASLEQFSSLRPVRRYCLGQLSACSADTWQLADGPLLHHPLPLLNHPLLRFTMNPLLSDRLASVHQFYTLQASQQLLLVLENIARDGQPVSVPTDCPIGFASQVSMALIMEEEEKKKKEYKIIEDKTQSFNHASSDLQFKKKRRIREDQEEAGGENIENEDDTESQVKRMKMCADASLASVIAVVIDGGILCLDVETITDGAYSQFTQIGAVLSMRGGRTSTFGAQVGSILDEWAYREFSQIGAFHPPSAKFENFSRGPDPCGLWLVCKGWVSPCLWWGKRPNKNCFCSCKKGACNHNQHVPTMLDSFNLVTGRK